MILITGGTGFVGRHIAARLIGAGVPVRLLARHPRETPGAELRVGDVTDRGSLLAAMEGCDAILHLVGIIREVRGQSFAGVHIRGTRNVLWACQQTGVRRLLHMSALGARANAAGEYLRTKWAAEESVHQSGLEATVFRPSIAFGEGGEFFPTLRRLVASPAPVIPIVGRGTSRFRPIWVEDIATCYTEALGKPETVGQTYELGGPEVFSFEQLLDLVAADAGVVKRKVHLPMLAVLPVAAGMSRVFPHFLVTPDQLAMLREGSTCDITRMVETFGITPASLRDHLHADGPSPP